jgi:TetR/AcrR family tetracycline transcriptional repressor
VALTRDAIVDAAVGLLERDGLEGLTLRRLGERLGVSAPTLMWHVGSKRRLLDLLNERLMLGAMGDFPLEPPPGVPWWTWLEQRTRTMYEGLVATRDAPRLVAGTRPTSAALPAIEALLTTLIEAGLEPGEAIEIVLALNSYVVGCALEWQAERDRMLEPPTEAAVEPELVEAVSSGRFPNTRRAFQEHRNHHVAASPHAGMFELGLSLMIEALRARVAARESTGDSGRR